jgi:NAD-dependent SIR2 family protein deacetylase
MPDMQLNVSLRAAFIPRRRFTSLPKVQATKSGPGDRGNHRLRVGKLRPDVLLYGDPHPDNGDIMATATRDAGTCPDLVLVVGTKLRVPGARSIATQICRAARRAGGTVFGLARRYQGRVSRAYTIMLLLEIVMTLIPPAFLMFMDRGHEKRF